MWMGQRMRIFLVWIPLATSSRNLQLPRLLFFLLSFLRMMALVSCACMEIMVKACAATEWGLSRLVDAPNVSCQSVGKDGN